MKKKLTKQQLLEKFAELDEWYVHLNENYTDNLSPEVKVPYNDEEMLNNNTKLLAEMMEILLEIKAIEKSELLNELKKLEKRESELHKQYYISINGDNDEGYDANGISIELSEIEKEIEKIYDELNKIEGSEKWIKN